MENVSDVIELFFPSSWKTHCHKTALEKLGARLLMSKSVSVAWKNPDGIKGEDSQEKEFECRRQNYTEEVRV